MFSNKLDTIEIQHCIGSILMNLYTYVIIIIVLFNLTLLYIAVKSP